MTLSKFRILLVEDDPDQAQLITLLLAAEQYDVTHVLDASAALIYLGEHPVDLLLVDWSLPGMKGDALITLAKGQYPTIATVLFSNHAHVGEAAAACSADAWLQKIDLNRLQPTIAALQHRGTDHR